MQGILPDLRNPGTVPRVPTAGKNVARRLRLLGSYLPDLGETSWLLSKDANGVFHDQRCEDATTATALSEHRLDALLAGEGCCPRCTGHVLDDKGSVGNLLLQLTTPLATYLERPTRERALAVLLRGYNRAVPKQHFDTFKREHLLPSLGSSSGGGMLCALTAGDVRDEMYAPETLLGPLLSVVADGFLAQSARGALLLYVASTDTPSSVRGHPRVLEEHWEAGCDTGAFEAFFMFGEDALSGAIEWGDIGQWWEAAKAL